MAQNQELYRQKMREGLLLSRARDYKRAAYAFRSALQEYPNQPAPYAGLGEACFGLKQLDRALECYKLAARYSRGDIRYLTRVADIQERLGQLRDASQTYMAAGEFMLRDRRLSAAIDHWERAIRLQADLLGAHQRLAMVFQRQGDVRRAVREYLAIARILQARGDEAQALRVCEAALRLDPGNVDVLTAIELVRYGEAAFDDDDPHIMAPLPEDDEAAIADTIRQMAAVFESERDGPAKAPDSPVVAARHLAQEQLAEEIFREEADDELMYGAADGQMSKLERDALIGQGIDFESRGRRVEAIACYEQAVAGGLDIPAVYFVLGLLYLDLGNIERGRRAMSRAARAAVYRAPAQAALQRKAA